MRRAKGWQARIGSACLAQAGKAWPAWLGQQGKGRRGRQGVVSCGRPRINREAWLARCGRAMTWPGRPGLEGKEGRDWRGMQGTVGIGLTGTVRDRYGRTGKTWRCKAWPGLACHGWRDLAYHGLARLDLARLARRGEARMARQARPCKERWAMRRRSGLTRQGLAVHVVGGTERQARRDRASKAWQDRHCCRFQSTAEWRPDWASQFSIPTTQT